MFRCNANSKAIHSLPCSVSASTKGKVFTYIEMFFFSLVSIVEKGHWFQLVLFHCFGPPMDLSGWMFVLSRKSLPIHPIATRAGFPCKLDRCLGTLSRGLGKFHHSGRRLAVAGHDILVSLLATTSPKKVGCSNNNED